MPARPAMVRIACMALLPAGSLLASEPYKDPSLPFEARVADLVPRMTLQEKAQQVQMDTPPNQRLGLVGANWWNEGLHGVSRAGRATIFPQAIAMAAMWDPPLMKQIATATADEARAKYVPRTRYQGLTLWAPTINLARDPRWGRVEETYGEDPFLTSRLAVSFVRGLQGDDPRYFKTIATPKHFAVHSQESGRTARSFDAPEEVIRDYYLPAFEAAFTEGKALSVMAAHNGINGIPSTANSWLLTDLLRTEWGFSGAVVTDWNAIQYLVNSHRYASDLPRSCAAAINAGVDVLCDPKDLSEHVVAAVQRGYLKEEALDRAVARNLLVRFRLGLFDPPELVPFTGIPASVVGAPAHLELALKAANQSFVLLKNDRAPRGYGIEKLLPLDLRRIDSIAVVGPYVNTNQYGAYSAGSPAGPAPTTLAALQSALGNRVRIRTADYNTGFVNSFKAAEESDVVIAVVGLNIQIEREGIDRNSLLLPRDQQTFLEGLVKANPLTIVLLEGGSPIGLSWVKENVPAAMMIWYKGEQGAIALAQTLLGQSNPSGKLPVTFYRANDDLPPLDDYDIRKGRTYMYLEKPPSFAFGHGLSYTAFEYRQLRLAATPDTPTMVDSSGQGSGAITATLEIANTGDHDGDEIVQLYVRVKQSASKRPIKQLKAFERVTIAKGASRPVTLTVPVSSLGFWNVQAKKYVVEPGVYEIMVGASSEDIRLRGEITIR